MLQEQQEEEEEDERPEANAFKKALLREHRNCCRRFCYQRLTGSLSARG